jgi:hypothetical protein
MEEKVKDIDSLVGNETFSCRDLAAYISDLLNLLQMCWADKDEIYLLISKNTWQYRKVKDLFSY